MADLTVFNQKEDGLDGFKYYNIPENYPLFKATKTFFDDKQTLTLQQNKLYFFGVKDTTPSYIENYEELYGVIFEFKTTKSYKLLALDDHDTMATLYEGAPSNIKTILEKNYGYHTGIRDSVAGPDDELSKYICGMGKQGYSIFNMETDMGGRFHPEFMICNAAAGVENVRQVTTEARVNSILREAELKRHAEDMKAARKKPRNTRITSEHKGRLFMDDDEELDNNGIPNKRLFGDDDESKSGPNKRLFGGSKKRGKITKGRKGKKSRKTRRVGRISR
jgi:hypothetical protein